MRPFLLVETKGIFLDFAKHKFRFQSVCFAKPLAVPEEICAPLPRLCLISFDRGAFLALLHPPPAAQGSSTSVTAKNEPPARFLNAASIPFHLQKHQQKRTRMRPFLLVETKGIEPSTSALRTLRSPEWHLYTPQKTARADFAYTITLCSNLQFVQLVFCKFCSAHLFFSLGQDTISEKGGKIPRTRESFEKEKQKEESVSNER